MTRPADPRETDVQDMIGLTVYYNGNRLGTIVRIRAAPFLHPGPMLVLDNRHCLRDIRGCERWEVRRES